MKHIMETVIKNENKADSLHEEKLEKQVFFNPLPKDNANPSERTKLSSLPIHTYEYSMKGHAAQCVDRYLELADKHVSTTCDPCKRNSTSTHSKHPDVADTFG